MENKLKKLPLGVQTFRDIIEDNHLYVDKTKELHELIESGKYYFISRPRRFGKSLLCSTLSEIFSGNKELFKGLYIYDKIDWQQHPVIHISLASASYSETTQVFRDSLIQLLIDTGRQYNIQIDKNNKPLKILFRELVGKLSERNKVVVLIDEYDKPIIDHITNPEKSKENREILREFYGIIKDLDQYLKFVLLTGVSKFSKVSVFSGLNNLTDITITERFSTIMGISQDELENNFDKYIDELANDLSTSRKTLFDDIKKWYNGYSWDGETRLYNPYSLLSLFSKSKFENYWFETGTTTFLLRTLKEKKAQIEDFEEKAVGSDVFEAFDIENIGLPSLLFQTGYLTIKDTKMVEMKTLYTLTYPNYEVKDSLLNNIISNYINKASGEVEPLIVNLKAALRKQKLDDFINITKSIFAGIPSQLHLSKEAYYHSLFYLILSLMGARIDLEVLTDKGRIDAVLEFEDKIYIIEFKLGSADDALKQIEDKKYCEKYIKSGKTTHLLGVGGFLEKNIEYRTKLV